MSTGFILDERLAADSFPIGSLPLSELRLMNDARFPWCLLVPRRVGASELIDLNGADRLVLLDEVAGVSKALKTATLCDKLNVAALGNMVPQLHVHVIARFAEDAAWPRPVWGAGAAVAYDPAERDRLVERLNAALPK